MKTKNKIQECKRIICMKNKVINKRITRNREKYFKRKKRKEKKKKKKKKKKKRERKKKRKK